MAAFGESDCKRDNKAGSRSSFSHTYQDTKWLALANRADCHSKFWNRDAKGIGGQSVHFLSLELFT